MCRYTSCPLFWGQDSITPAGTLSGEAPAMAAAHHSAGGHQVPHPLLSDLVSRRCWSLCQA